MADTDQRQSVLNACKQLLVMKPHCQHLTMDHDDVTHASFSCSSRKNIGAMENNAELGNSCKPVSDDN